VPEEPHQLPDFVSWPSFPFEGDLRVKALEPATILDPARRGEDAAECPSCMAPDEAYIWVSDRWRVRATERPTGLPMVLILESRSHLDLGDLSNLLAAELGVMTVRLERAIRSLDGVARVHVNRWGDGAAHFHLWFLARPTGQLQLCGSFLSMWQDILPPAPEAQWRENLALIAAWLAEFGGRAFAEPPRIDWQAPATLARVPTLEFEDDVEPRRDDALPHSPADEMVGIRDGEAAGAGPRPDAGSASDAHAEGGTVRSPGEDENAGMVENAQTGQNAEAGGNGSSVLGSSAIGQAEGRLATTA
jgi:diadenosine tetraphosphate (Ap4A) HIT family hydrolase